MAEDKSKNTPIEEKKKEAQEVVNEAKKDEKAVEETAKEVVEEKITAEEKVVEESKDNKDKAIEEKADDKVSMLEDFNVGDKIVVNYRITEGKKTRIQPFEGLVIGIKNSGISKTFTVRRIGAASIGVERIFPLYSPNIDSIKVKSKGKVRRAKLYYLRDRVGKAALKVKEKK